MSPCTFLDVGSFLPNDVRVLRERDVDLESDSLRLGVQICQNELSGLLDIGWQTHNLHLGVWGNGRMGDWENRLMSERENAASEIRRKNFDRKI